MDAISSAAHSYIQTFSSFVNQFTQWGQWLFGVLFAVNFIWLMLWYAFDKESLTQGLADFIKRFFIMMLFYTIMLHPQWLLSVLQTVEMMGSQLTHQPIDPASIVAQGIGIANKIIVPVAKSSFLTLGFGGLVILVVYVVILFTFISIALELALTLIMTTALISVSTFFLGFAALNATSQIARQTLDVVLANCVKLLGIYLVVAAGAKTISDITQAIPSSLVSFDPYVWIVAAALLFWLLAKNLPNQLAKMVSGTMQETHGTDVAALALSAIRYAEIAKPVASKVSGVTAKASGVMLAREVASRAMNHARAHFNKPTKTQATSSATPQSAAVSKPKST